jgi:cytochrome c oxidase cbb3-type subunit 3/ubiquinol-cytochrome c reductase cytochrome c subunit
MLLFVAAGCSHLPGKPGDRSETLRPDQTLGFEVLYKSNCSACHGENGLNGAAMPLNNPVYLAWAGHDRMVPIVASGASLRAMHAFAQSSGGMLTDRQVESIVNGMISHWGKPGILNGANPPGYTATTPGDVAAGKAAFETHCARCHGADGTGPTDDASSKQGVAVGSIIDPTYLSLISTQGLRDIIVSGLPGEGMPDWRGDKSAKLMPDKPMPDKPMTDKEVTDVVAWLASHRVQSPRRPGQPFPTAQR